MAITFLQEIWSGRTGNSNGVAVRTYERAWLVRTDSMLSGPLEATDDVRFPLKYASYAGLNGEYDLGSTLREYDVRDTDDPFTKVVVAKYTSERNRRRRVSEDPNKLEGKGQKKGDQSEQNPLLQPAQIRFSTQKFKQAITQDANNIAIASTNGERFDPPLEIDQSRLVMTIQKNLAAFPNSMFFNTDPTKLYQDVVNSDVWQMPTAAGTFTFQPGMVKLDGASADTVTQTGMFFWRVSVQFAFRILSPNWNVQILNVGTYTIDAQGNAHAILDMTSGHPITSPVPLDLMGKPVPLTPPIAYTYSTFQPYPQVPFTPLNALLNLP